MCRAARSRRAPRGALARRRSSPSASRVEPPDLRADERVGTGVIAEHAAESRFELAALLDGATDVAMNGVVDQAIDGLVDRDAAGTQGGGDFVDGGGRTGGGRNLGRADPFDPRDSVGAFDTADAVDGRSGVGRARARRGADRIPVGAGGAFARTG